MLAPLGALLLAGQAAAEPWESKQAAILGAPSRLAMIAARQDGRTIPTATAQPAVYRPAISSGGPDIFGTTALRVTRTAMDARWRGVATAGLSGPGSWTELLSRARGASRRDQIVMVNAWVNARVAYVDDARQYGVADYWAPAAQTLTRRAGDCEDYAIAKLQLLRALGFPADDLFLAVMRDLVGQVDHAALIVRIDGRLVMLDNRFDRLTDAEAGGNYRPILSYGAAGSWVHGYAVARNAAPTPAALALSAREGPPPAPSARASRGN